MRVIYVAVRTEAHTYALKMLHSMHIYLNHNRIVPQGLIYIYIYILVKQWKGCLWKPQPWWELPDMQQYFVSYVG